MMKHRKRSCANAGMTLPEVMFALVIFTAIALMFSAVIPTAARSNQAGSQYQQAINVVQHKIDQMQEAGYTYLAGSQLYTRGIIDSATSQTSPPYTYSFTTTDKLTSYFPTGATGTIIVNPLASSYVVADGSYSIWTVTVTVTWRNAGRKTTSYSGYTAIGKG